jgi:hypothetical protein
MLPDDCLILQSAGFFAEAACTGASPCRSLFLMLGAGRKRPMHRTICEQAAPQHITT